MSQDYRYQQLEQALQDDIRRQRYRPGERLPSVRTLCQQRGVSKATVLHALQRLEARRLIESRPKSGFYVLPEPPQRLPLTSAGDTPLVAPRPVSMGELWLDMMQRGGVFDIRPQAEPQMPAGIVALNRSISRALRHQRGEEHQYYADPAGVLALREQVALQLQRRGCRISAAQLAITSGCQQALFLALMACCRAGDVVAVEAPGFYGVLQLLERLQLQVLEIPSDPEQGMDMAALADVLERWPVRACIVSPAFSTPAGALLPVAARQRLLALADQYDLAIIEDDIYADTAFAGVPDPLLALDQQQRVILCGSLSKSLSRDIRIGWVHGGRWHRQIEQLRLITQLAGSRAIQQGVAAFMADGHYQAHLRRLRLALREQRDTLLHQLSCWPQPLPVSVPEGGLALWMQLPAGCDSVALYHRARQAGLALTPGALFSASGQYREFLRLGFAHPWTPARLQALQQLGTLIHDPYQ